MWSNRWSTVCPDQNHNGVANKEKKMNENTSSSRTGKTILIIISWAVTLLVSMLPDILFRELTGSLPAWLYWAKVGLVIALLLISLVWKRLRPLWLFSAVLLAVYLLEWGVGGYYQSVAYKTWLSGASSFVRDIGSVQIPRVTTGLLLVMIMLALMGGFKQFFLVKGDLNARAAPIPLIMTRPSSWNILGPAIAAAMPLGLLVFVFAFGSLPSLQSLKGIPALLPFVFLFAASNAFGEEMLYRAPWLGALENPVGPAQALLMTAVYFGIEHFYGVPYGILGVILAFIPGWLIGKSMLETRGFFWAWFIHFWMDVVIFFFIALGSVTPGG
jgi:membrane protease YdiL (CAAX protease family)